MQGLTKHTEMQEGNNIICRLSETEYINLLLVGEVGSGKSTFINTCATAFREEDTVIHPAHVLKPSGEAVTKRVC